MSETGFVASKLRDLCAKLTDGSHFSPAPQEVGHPIANVKDLRDGFVDLAACTRISDAAFRELFAAGCTIAPGDVLLSKDGTVGKVVVYEQPELIGALSSICIMHPGNDIDHRFLGHALQSESVRRQIDNAMSGSALRRLVLRDIAQITVPLPQLPEQHTMAEILDTLDGAIRRTEQIIAKLKLVKQGLVHDLLTRGIDENGELRDPERYPEQFKESCLGKLPREWDVVSFREVVTEVYRYPTYYGIKYVEDGVPEVRGELLQADGSLESDRSHYRQISNDTASRFPRVRLRPDDFVMTVRGTIGKVARIPAWLTGAVITANLIKITLNQRAHPEWAKYCFVSKAYQRALDLATSATTIKTIQVPLVLGIRLALPRNLQEQEEITDRLAVLDKRIAIERDDAAKLRLLKQGLMVDLLTGRVRVTNLEAAA